MLKTYNPVENRRGLIGRMEITFLLVAALILLLLVRLFPDLVAPRCPICSAHLQPTARFRKAFKLIGWSGYWRTFVCPQCLYRKDLFRISRQAEGMKNETRA